MASSKRHFKMVAVRSVVPGVIFRGSTLVPQELAARVVERHPVRATGLGRHRPPRNARLIAKSNCPNA